MKIFEVSNYANVKLPKGEDSLIAQYSSVKHFFLLSVPSAPLWFVKKIDFDKEF
jgi:hypothetical protein